MKKKLSANQTHPGKLSPTKEHGITDTQDFQKELGNLK